SRPPPPALASERSFKTRMSDLTVEMVQRGRGPSTEEAARRLGVAREIRSAREKLTSQTGLERAFDYELLRHYAQYRAGAGIPLALFAGVLAAAATFWITPPVAAAWAVCVFLMITLNTSLSRRFLHAEPATIPLAGFSRGMDALMLVAMAGGAQLFFLGLAHRLYTSTVGALRSRAEKDAVFGELEQAKANSDEARRRAEEANLAKSRFLATMSH